jgi:hypothetical protein
LRTQQILQHEAGGTDTADPLGGSYFIEALTSELEERGRQATLHSEMSDLLQSCLTVEEAYTVIGAFMPKFFPSRSGALGVLSASRNHVAIVAQWGNSSPSDRAFPPDQCANFLRHDGYAATPSRTAL